MRPQDFRPEDLFAQISALEKALEAERRARQLAEAASGAKSQILATVGREVRAPLGVLVSMADLLVESGLDDRQRRHAETMRSASRGLAALLDDVLHPSRIDRTPRTSEPAKAGNGARRELPGAALSGRVLVVEDNAVNQMLIAAYLDKFGLAHAIAPDAHQALEAIENGAFDLVLMDVSMPGMDGFEATRRVRALPGGAANVPIVALTARAARNERETCLAAGMDGHVAKPINGGELFAALAAHLPPAQARQAARG